MPINTKNDKKNEAVKKFLATFLKKLNTEIKITHYKKIIFEKQRKYNCVAHEIIYLEWINLGIKQVENIQFKSIDNIDSIKKLKEAELFFSKNEAFKKLSFQIYKDHINSSFLIYADLEIQLDALFNKAHNLFCQGFDSAGNAIHELIFNFKKINQVYFKENKIKYNKYKLKALAIIDDAKLILGQHRGYKKLLGNIALLILTLGIAFIVNKIINNHFLFFQKTKSLEQLDKLEYKISKLSF